MSDVEKISVEFCKGQYDWRLHDKIWPEVFKYISDNINRLTLDKPRVHILWTVSGGHLRRKVANDDLVLSVLQKVLPKYEGPGLILYRGECHFLYDDNRIGFCWTPKEDVARNFASGINSIESGGVLLKVYAHSFAIIASPNDHSTKQMKEFEYTCNPKSLKNIHVIDVFDKR